MQNTQNPLCLKQFLDHHGLSLLWIFMVELSEAKSNSVNNIKLQMEVKVQYFFYVPLANSRNSLWPDILVNVAELK